MLGPPGTGKTHLAIALGIRACLAGQRVAFATATEWVAQLGEAKRQGGLEAELRRLCFVPLIVVDEVGYIPFDPEAANLMFSLVSARYERASMIVTSNKPFSAWGEIFGDEVTATAMIDRLVHHAEILSLKGDSYRLRDKDLGGPPPPTRLKRTTDHTRRRRRGPQIGSQGPDPGQIGVGGQFRRGPSRSPAPAPLALRASLRGRPTQSGWTTFQPAEVAQFSTGLDRRVRG